jgi:molybdopterin/thiamine biosynthesis adenylyltransferase/SH3-like domain-containing protein
MEIAMDLTFSEDEIQRYSRHILLPELGGTGQARLRDAGVLVIGAGGLGSPLALYLAAAGIGRIGLVDDDVVELSNLQRQIAHGTPDLGRPKVDSAAEALRRLNPQVRVETHQTRLTAANAAPLIAAYDIICDGTDNFDTRFLINDTCVAGHRTLVSAAVLRFEGQLATFKPHADPAGPCYRCLHPAPPPPGLVPSCSEAGILGAVTGVLGALQATEVIKEVTGIGASLSGYLLVWHALDATFRKIRLRKDPQCRVCAKKAALFFKKALLALLFLTCCPAFGSSLGSVTQLPVPRFVSLRTDEVNVRAGPGAQYPVIWVYHRAGLPVEIIAEFDIWRQIQAPDGGTGWVHEATLRARRGFYIIPPAAILRSAPSDDAGTVATLTQGVSGSLLSCAPESLYCKVAVGPLSGYLARVAFWGTLPDETVK